MSGHLAQSGTKEYLMNRTMVLFGQDHELKTKLTPEPKISDFNYKPPMPGHSIHDKRHRLMKTERYISEQTK